MAPGPGRMSLRAPLFIVSLLGASASVMLGAACSDPKTEQPAAPAKGIGATAAPGPTLNSGDPRDGGTHASKDAAPAAPAYDGPVIGALFLQTGDKEV